MRNHTFSAIEVALQAAAIIGRKINLLQAVVILAGKPGESWSLISLPSESNHYLSDIVVGVIITVTILAWLRRFYFVTLNQVGS